MSSLQVVSHGFMDRIAGALFAVRMVVSRSVATVAGGLNAIDAGAANGLRWIGLRLRNATLYVVATLRHATLSSGRAMRGAVLFVSSGLAAGTARAGTEIQRAGTKIQRAGTKIQVAAPAVGNAVARGYGVVAASTQRISDTIGPARNRVFVGSRTEP